MNYGRRRNYDDDYDMYSRHERRDRPGDFREEIENAKKDVLGSYSLEGNVAETPSYSPQRSKRSYGTDTPPDFLRAQALQHVMYLREASLPPFAPASISPSYDHVLRVVDRIKKEHGITALPYQLEAAQWLISGSHRPLFDGMGLGKTLEALISLPSAQDAGTLVVCPASTRKNWMREAERFRPDLMPILCMQKQLFRFPGPGEIIFIGWDSLPDDWTNFAPEVPFCLVVDEAHYAKNPDSSRATKIKKISVLAHVIYGLTGTPLPNKAIDIYHVLGSMCLDRLLGPASSFEEAFFIFEKGRKIADCAHVEFKRILKMLSLRRMTKDVMAEVPPLRIKVVQADLRDGDVRDLDEIMRLIGAADEKHFADLIARIEDAQELRVKGESQKTHLSQLRDRLCLAKLKEALNIVEEIRSQEDDPPVVLYSPFMGVVRSLEQKGWPSIRGGMSDGEKQYVIDRFNRGEFKKVVISDSAGTGVNLQGPKENPCTNMVRVGLSFSPAVNNQVLMRVYRTASKIAYGQSSNPTLIYDIVADYKADEIVYKILSQKENLLDDLGLGMETNPFN